MCEQLDHENKPVPVDESSDSKIKVWQITINDGDALVMRGWGDMLEQLAILAERQLEFDTEDELDLNIKLISMLREDYDDIYDNI